MFFLIFFLLAKVTWTPWRSEGGGAVWISPPLGGRCATNDISHPAPPSYNSGRLQSRCQNPISASFFLRSTTLDQGKGGVRAHPLTATPVSGGHHNPQKSVFNPSAWMPRTLPYVMELVHCRAQDEAHEAQWVANPHNWFPGFL